MANFSDAFKKNYIASTSEGYLYLTILPTEQCNFRCVYCYEDFSIGKMSNDTVEGVKALLTKAAPTLKLLKISWFGGEPTLNAKAVRDISKHIQALQQRYDFGYSAIMTTNAYILDQEMFSEFVDLGIDTYQVTLDGVAESHDQTRVRINGKGSFDQIWQNLLSYKQLEQDFRVNLRLHVTKDNAQSMLALCDMLNQAFDNDHRYGANVKAIKDLGKGTEKADANAVIAEDKMARVEDVVERLKDFNGIRGEVELNKENPYICYAAMPRHLMIRANGRIGKCTVMLSDDRNDMGHLAADGSYQIDGKKVDLWSRGFVDLNPAVLGCPATGMPKQTKEPKYDSQVEIVEVA